jgi:hypothetical protein
MIRTTVKLLKPTRLTLDDIFEHPYLLLSIVAICLAFIIFILYNYYISTTDSKILTSYTFFSKNPALDPPIYQVETPDSITCQTRCIQDPTCDGFTYDTNNSLCIGVKNGILKSEDANFSAWVKPVTVKDPYMSKTILTGYANNPFTVKYQDIQPPVQIGQFTYSLWINITDWYLNFEYWKHIAHKGSPIEGNLVNYREWSDIVNQLPDQCIGLWLAPFTNNLRIAVTTESITSPDNDNKVYDDANVVLCNTKINKCILSDQLMNINKDIKDAAHPIISKNLEYVDINNIPINKLYHIAVSFSNNMMEIYTNGRLFKVVTLKGQPIFNRGNMYIKFDKSFNGTVYQLAYTSLYTKISDISQFYNSKPQLK